MSVRPLAELRHVARHSPVAGGYLLALVGLLLLVGLAFLDVNRANAFVAVFLGIFLEAFPYLLLGVVVSTFLEALVSPERMQRLLPTHRIAAPIAGSLIGLVLPVCECGVIPVARRLLLKGAPLPAAIGFALAGPVLNPVVIVSTWVAFDGDPLILGGRLGLTFLIAVVVAALAGLWYDWPLHEPRPSSSRASSPVGATAPAGTCWLPATTFQATARHESPGAPGAVRHSINWPALCAHAVDELVEVGKYLVLGAALAAAVQAFVPRSALLALGQDAVSSTAVLMALGALLSICSTVDAFVALSFAGAVGPGALLGFLVYGPMVDVKSALMLTAVFRSRFVVFTLGLATLMVFATTVAINLLVGS